MGTEIEVIRNTMNVKIPPIFRSLKKEIGTFFGITELSKIWIFLRSLPLLFKQVCLCTDFKSLSSSISIVGKQSL